MARDKRKGGRVTPSKSAQAANRPARPPRRSVLPAKVGPFERPDANRPLGQVGRRPSSPRKLALFGGVYIVCGVASFVLVGGTAGIILGVVLVGVGLLWMRGAATAQLRQQRRREEP